MLQQYNSLWVFTAVLLHRGPIYVSYTVSRGTTYIQSMSQYLDIYADGMTLDDNSSFSGFGSVDL